MDQLARKKFMQARLVAIGVLFIALWFIKRLFRFNFLVVMILFFMALAAACTALIAYLRHIEKQ